mmetsp:Transcript_79772/g.133252  ORF Transcript_79772/g.133252 Transcript_79772/m.133252 type:complete len:229 (+) Transcript_79772:324-1010(+)
MDSGAAQFVNRPHRMPRASAISILSPVMSRTVMPASWQDWIALGIPSCTGLVMPSRAVSVSCSCTGSSRGSSVHSVFRAVAQARAKCPWAAIVSMISMNSRLCLNPISCSCPSPSKYLEQSGKMTSDDPFTWIWKPLSVLITVVILRFEVFEAKVFVSSFGRCAMALSYPQKLTKSRRPCSIPSMIPIPCLGLLSLLLPTLSYGSAKFRDSDLHTSSRTFGFVACRLF